MGAVLVSKEEAGLPKHADKRARVESDLDQVLSDPELRATLRDIMAGLSEALSRVSRLEIEVEGKTDAAGPSKPESAKKEKEDGA
jgi:UDP:flavonoid glycosyltransferase YjiC (YdhE family)